MALSGQKEITYAIFYIILQGWDELTIDAKWIMLCELIPSIRYRNDHWLSCVILYVGPIKSLQQFLFHILLIYIYQVPNTIEQYIDARDKMIYNMLSLPSRSSQFRLTGQKLWH